MTTTRPRPRPFLLLLALAAVAVAVLGLVAPASASTSSFCGITWGSLLKHGSTASPVPGAEVVNVRAGVQPCYDRLVVDIRDATAMNTWRVEYVRQVYSDPRGTPIALRGGAFLQISVGASDHDQYGHATYRPANSTELVNVSGFPVFRQVAWAGSSEGVSSIGLGVRARLPFRVLTVTGIPGSTNGVRLVIDVARAW